jgi:cyclic pyranopterin phosphate synthase
VKLNCVLLRDHNLSEATALVEFALRKGCQMRFLELMPLGPGAECFRRSFAPVEQVSRALAGRFALTEMPRRAGGTSRDFVATDGEGHTGIVGFISPVSQPFCVGCRRLRLTSTGELIGCLRSDSGADLHALLNSPCVSGEALEEVASREMDRKLRGCGFRADHSMASIGG